MKLLVASDIHGSAYYCEKLLKRMEEENPDQLLLLGDVLYHGPRNDLPKGYAPKEVIAMLNPLAAKIRCVRGNCEAEVDQMVLDFPVLADYALFEMANRRVFATHGHHYNINSLPKLSEGDILIYGHTHIPLHETKDGILCLNPGSVSIPKADSAHSFIVWDEDVISWRDLDGAEYFSMNIRRS